MPCRNGLASAADIADFRTEGGGAVSFPRGRPGPESRRPPEEGQDANAGLTVHPGQGSCEVPGLSTFRRTDTHPRPGGRIGFRQIAPTIGEYPHLLIEAP